MIHIFLFTRWVLSYYVTLSFQKSMGFSLLAVISEPHNGGLAEIQSFFLSYDNL